jgi:hypothetical protein
MTLFSPDKPSLRKDLSLIADQSTVTGYIILFLDGLDKCSGDNRAQIDFLNRLVRSPKRGGLSLRLCVATPAVPEIEPRLRTCP